MKKILAVLGVVLVLGALLGMSVVGSRNSLVNADEAIPASWAQVEIVLQRRNDLIPNLVNVTKGYAKHEKDVFTQIAESRAKLAGARTIPEKINANEQIGSAISRLLVIAERYPDLKANQNFMNLQDELAGTENRIAVERRRYNETVQTYNVLVRRFPSNIAAAIFGFQKKDIYFKADEGAKTAPHVEF